MLRFAFFLTFSFVLAAAAFAQTQNPGALVQDAISKQQAGDLDGAIPEYRAFLKVHPEVGAIHANLGAALSGTGHYEEAIKEYRQALKLAPSTPGLHLNLALAYYKMGRIDDAASVLARVVKAEPKNYQATILLGDCYLRMGKNPETIKLLEPLSKSRPDDLAVAYMLGTALLRNKQLNEGSAVIDRILRNGESAETHLLLGMSKFEALEYPEAITDLTKAAEMNPELPDVYSLLGQAQMASGDTQAARAAFEKELAHNPNDFESNVRMAVLTKQDGDYARTHQLLDRALLVRPEDPGAVYQLGVTYLAEGKLDRACTILQNLVKDSPHFLEAHVSLAQVYYRLKRKEDGDREREIVQKLKAEQDAQQSKTKGEAQPRP